MKALIVEDGVSLEDNEPLPGAVEFVRWLVTRGVPYLFLTNYRSQTPADLRNRLLGAGLDVPAAIADVIPLVQGQLG